MRRAKGEGALFQRPDGRWIARTYVERTDGSTVRREVTGKTRAAVVRRLGEVRKDADAGLSADARKQTTGAYLERWLADVASHRVRPTTYRGYEHAIRKCLAPEIGARPLRRLTAQDLSTAYGRLLERGLSRRTVALCHAVLRTALRQAVLWDLVPRNVTALVTPPKQERPQMQTLSAVEARRFLVVARNDELAALWMLAVSTGARQGELLGLHWPDIDLAGGRLVIRSTLVRVGSGWSVAEPKTARSRRTVLLTPDAVTSLRAHRVRQLEQRLRGAELWREHGFVFTDDVGEPLDGRTVTSHRLPPLLRNAECPRIRFHDLRHTAATLLLEEGVHPKVVQEMLGHSTIAVTLDIYSHVTPTMQATAVDAMARALGG